MTLSDADAACVAATKALVADLLWLAAKDLQDSREGIETTEAHLSWLERGGFGSPLEEIEAFWAPNPFCRMYISLITDIPPESICMAVLASSPEQFAYRQKLSISANLARWAVPDELLDEDE